MTELLIASKIQMLSKMFLHRREQLDPKPRHDGRFVTMKPRAPTVAARFHDSLQALVEQMSQCNPWFIRCVRSYAFALIFSSSSSEPAADSSASSAPSCCRHHISAKIRLMTSPQIYLRAGHTLQCHATRPNRPAANSTLQKRTEPDISVTLQMSEAQRREGGDEVRHAACTGANSVFWYYRHCQNKENRLPPPLQIPAIC